jgi:hypothetical protein
MLLGRLYERATDCGWILSEETDGGLQLAVECGCNYGVADAVDEVWTCEDGLRHCTMGMGDVVMSEIEERTS